MTPAARRISALVGSILVLAACGTLSPSASPQASGNNEPASQPAELPAVVCVPAPTLQVVWF
jgi:hypothetical protein